jgi:hypothetical protein
MPVLGCKGLSDRAACRTEGATSLNCHWMQTLAALVPQDAVLNEN